ncbi:MAG TPA: helix-turn-helix transcriptional regulator [Clostridia bacterium]|nr:helix-turn-helix transcriptional regulator [Clostridia bacterium]HHY06205.1 helix-turn-helix transcriptional regulator [Clostridia bacterium]
MLLENSIGSKIKIIREKQGLSQSEVVTKLKEKNINLSRETLSKIENNNRTISAIELKALCSVLDADINEIFSENETKDDLVTLFRKKGCFNEQTLEEIEYLQEMVKVFINQERICKGELLPQKRKPLWEECLIDFK